MISSIRELLMIFTVNTRNLGIFFKNVNAESVHPVAHECRQQFPKKIKLIEKSKKRNGNKKKSLIHAINYILINECGDLI